MKNVIYKNNTIEESSNNKKSKMGLNKKVALTGMFAALAFIFTVISHYLHITIVPSVSFLTYDPKDIIICIAGFILGPISAFAISFIVSFIEMLTISNTAFYGLIMNVISTCAFVIPAAIIYRYKKSFAGALISLIVGFVSALIVMTLWNIIITPVYMNVPRNVLIQKFLIPIVIFNAIKVGLNIAFTLLLYKPLIGTLRALKIVDSRKNKFDVKSTLIMVGIGLFLLATLFAAIYLIKKYM